MRVRHRGSLACATALIGAALAASGCGGSGEEPASATSSVSSVERVQDLQLVTCDDWKRADEATRLDIVRNLREIVGGPVIGRGASGTGSVLEDVDAEHLFDATCEQTFARGFVLYKLYSQAAGFAGVAP